MHTIRIGLLTLVGLSMLIGCDGRISSSRNLFDIQRLSYVRQTDEPTVIEVAIPVVVRERSDLNLPASASAAHQAARRCAASWFCGTPDPTRLPVRTVSWGKRGTGH